MEKRDNEIENKSKKAVDFLDENDCIKTKRIKHAIDKFSKRINFQGFKFVKNDSKI
jgi:hypothetical protein